MAPSMSLFSRRKTSEGGGLRTALLTNVDPLSASATSSLSMHKEDTPIATPLSPKFGSTSSKLFTKGSPVVLSGYSAGSAGIVYAPHLTRPKASAMADATAPTTGLRINGALEQIPIPSRSNSDVSSSNSGSRRARSVDQKTPSGNHPGYSTPSAVSSPTPSLASPPAIPLPTTPPVPTGAGHDIAAGGFYLPISPPLSPESPMGNKHDITSMIPENFLRGARKSESELSAEIAALKKAVNLRDLAIAKLDTNVNIGDALESAPKTEAQRVNQILCRRIKDLENKNREKDFEIAQQSTQIKSLRETHAAVLDAMKESHAEEIVSLRKAARSLELSVGCSLEDVQEMERLKERESELLAQISQKDNEIEYLQVNTDGLREQIAVMETVVAGKDEELEHAKRKIQDLSDNSGSRSTLDGIADLGLADMGRRLLEEIRRREKAEKKLEEAMVKARNGLEAVLVDEGKKREQVRATVWKEFEQTLAQEERRRTEIQRKAKEDLDYVLVEEEKRRAEINWIFNSKIETLETQLRVDSEEFRKQIEALLKTKAELEERIARMSEELEKDKTAIMTQKTGNEDLIQMVKRINHRLGEEKKKNKRLEVTVGQITKEAVNNVSGANSEAALVRIQLEERDATITSLETELDALRMSKDAAEDTLMKLQIETSTQQQGIEDRDERIKDLETESGELRDKIDSLLKQTKDLKKNSELREQYFAKLSENFTNADSSPVEIEVMEKRIHQMEVDIDLYRQDIKGYKKDVKKRDAKISTLSKELNELEAKFQQKIKETQACKSALDTGVLRDLPPATCDETQDSGKIKDENAQLRQKIYAVEEEREALRKKHDAFTSQQSLIISGMEAQLAKIKKEKEAIEHAAAKQLRRMQQSFQQLSQAAVAGGLPPAAHKYQSNPLPPLPASALDLDLKKKGESRRKKSQDGSIGKRRPASLVGSNGAEMGNLQVVGEKGADGVEEKEKGEKEEGPAPSPLSVSGSPSTETRYKRLSEKERLQRTLSAINEPDGALGDEEIIEW